MTGGSWPVAAPPRIAALLRAAPDGEVRVCHRSPQAVYVDIGGQCVGVAAAGAARLPISLRTPRILVSSDGGGCAYVESGVLCWGERSLVAGRLVEVRAPRLDLDRIPLTSPAASVDVPQSHVAGLVASVPLRPDTVASYVGRGDGLTPLGDDVVCGWLALHRAAGIPTPDLDAALRDLLPRTTLLSASLLEAALLGEVADEVGAYLRALSTPRAAAARAALTRVGHSSGHGLAHGVDAALASVREIGAAA